MKKWLVIFIFLIALFLRVYKLGQYPVGFLWDEAALGYNSYSILQTARDEYGDFLPLIFKSFGDYKPGFYVYLAIPSILVFGLNEFGVRFPSAFGGALSVLFFYLLIKEGLKLINDDEKQKTGLPEKIALTSSFLLAVSPWHINFSRGAWELNIMLFEIVLGIYLLFKSINTQKKTFLLISCLIFLLTLFTYQSAKLLTPALLFVLFIFFRKELKTISLKFRMLFLGVFFGGFIVFNLLSVLGGKSGRIKTMSVFSYPRSEAEKEMILTQDNNNQLRYLVFHSSPIFFARSVLGRYFNYFSGKFLFSVGDWSNPRNSVVYQGVLYYPDLIFLLLGLGILLAKAKKNPLENFFLFWLLLAPLPAALTRDSISSVRSYSMVLPLIFFISCGINEFISFTMKIDKEKLFRKILFSFFGTGFILIYLFFFVRFLDLYFVHDPLFSSQSRLYGYKEVVNFINPLIKDKSNVVFSTTYGQPYIFYLFYTQYDPRIYQKKANLKENIYGDVGQVEKLDNIAFRKIYFPDDQSLKSSLFIGDEFDLPLKDIVGRDSIFYLKEIKYLDGKTAFRIVQTE